MRNARLRAVVFDFDGTLAELTIDFELMKRRLLALARRVVPDAPEPGATPALEWLDAVTDRLARTDPGAARRLSLRMHAEIRAVETEAASRGRLFSFSRPLLSSLAAAGTATAIVTRNCAEALQAVFPDAALAVGVVLCRDDVPRVKPDPAHVLAALEALGVEPGRALMVGDHVLDIETGRRAGMASAGVLTGKCTREQFLAAGARWVAGDAAELLSGPAGPGCPACV